MPERAIIECVPNFSEGRNKDVINKIVQSIASVDGVRVLNVDAGEAANRTVVTFIGQAEKVVEAAFRGARCAQSLIDMRRHHGEHPRVGATDVLPLVPVSGITLEECAELARSLAQRIYDELGIPTYCYEAAARDERRRNLAVCRQGEYEGLRERIERGDGPDNGTEWNETVARSGATVVGARGFLIAVNFNLNTTDAALAHEIACDVRQLGRKVDGTWVRGTLRGVKALGWYIEEYGKAQVSMNITDIVSTPLHRAFDEVCRAAEQRGVRVTGTEIIGLVPRQCLVDAGRHFAVHRTHSLADAGNTSATTASAMTDDEAIALAIRAMRLDELCPFADKLLN